jgi:hypothetical protein
VTEGIDDGVGEGETEGFGLAATFTPLLQTSLLPDLTQVYFKPLTVEVNFNFAHGAPALTAALAIFKFIGSSKTAEQRTARNDLPLLMGKQ